MSDDFMSLMGDSSDDDDIFDAFASPGGDVDLSFDATFDAGDDDFAVVDDSLFVGDTSEEVPEESVIPTTAPPQRETRRQRVAKKRKRTESDTGFLGMTAVQRMVLSIFLFLDVSMMSLMILIAIGAIKV